ncbi:hypothetical protein ACWCQQ_42250 [Streptomyces sp. NPDC002143]
MGGRPVPVLRSANWPERWEESFGQDELDDLYEEISSYELRVR